MSNLTRILHEKRTRLTNQATQQRNQITQNLMQLQQPLKTADVVINMARFAHQHPWLMIGTGYLIGQFRVARLMNAYNKLKLVWGGLVKLQSFIKRS